jgi:hypothetical protein
MVVPTRLKTVDMLSQFWAEQGLSVAVLPCRESRTVYLRMSPAYNRSGERSALNHVDLV